MSRQSVLDSHFVCFASCQYKKLYLGAQVFKATIDGVAEVAVKIFHEVHSQLQQADILREVAILKSCRCAPQYIASCQTLLTIPLSKLSVALG